MEMITLWQRADTATFEVRVRIWPRDYGSVGYTERTIEVLHGQAVYDILRDYQDVVREPQNETRRLYMKFRGTTGVEKAERLCRRLEAFRVELTDK